MLGDGQTQHQHQICRLQARPWSSVCLGVHFLIAHIPPFHPEMLSLSKLQCWFCMTRAWFGMCFRGLLFRTMY